MPVIFKDPVGWSALAVATRERFWFSAICMSILQVALVFMAIDGGWRAAIGLVGLLVFAQFLYMFALREIYLRYIKMTRAGGR